MLPLDGYTVIDLSVGIAGAYCTKLLADGGATVIKVEPPEGDPLRRWSASGAEIKTGDDGALFSFLAGAKSSVVADPAADVDFVNGLLEDAFVDNLELFKSKPDAALKYVSHGEYQRDAKLNVSELAAYTSVTSLILNLNEVVMKE